MKQECYRRPRVSGFGLLEILVVMALIVIVAGGVYVGFGHGSFKQPVVPDEVKPHATAPTGPVDRTVTGNAPGQLTTETPSSLPGKVMRRAISTKCQENLRQLRMLIDIAKNESEDGNTYPASLGAIREAAQIQECPVGHKPYQYDPTTGKVSCIVEGHEGY